MSYQNFRSLLSLIGSHLKQLFLSKSLSFRTSAIILLDLDFIDYKRPFIKLHL